MGYSTRDIDVNTGLRKTVNWEVVSASDEVYFKCAFWRNPHRIEKCELKDNNKTAWFHLNNGDFVEVGYKG